MNCQHFQSVLPNLLLDPAAKTNVEARAHLAVCGSCNQEFRSLEATFALLDSWRGPEPSAYFDQKLAVRIREAHAMAPAGWFEQWRARLLFNTGRQFRPALAGAMALVLLAGGGTYANVANLSHPNKQASATVEDLQILDKNDQALQAMDQLLQEDGSTDDGVATSPAT